MNSYATQKKNKKFRLKLRKQSFYKNNHAQQKCQQPKSSLDFVCASKCYSKSLTLCVYAKNGGGGVKLTKPPRKPLFRVPVRSRCISYRTRRMQKTHIRFVKHLRKLLILTTVANDLSPSRPDCGSARILFRGTEKSRRGNGPKTRITHEITFPHKPKLIKLRAVKIQRGDSERR